MLLSHTTALWFSRPVYQTSALGLKGISHRLLSSQGMRCISLLNEFWAGFVLPHRYILIQCMLTMKNLSGSWLGTYWQGRQSTRFEATLVQGGSVLDGRILDDGHLGEACVRGELIGGRIFFVKRYLTTSPSPIRYSGTLSEDGNYMHGNWRIGNFDSGSWEAYRVLDFFLPDLAKRLAADYSTVARLVD